MAARAGTLSSAAASVRRSGRRRSSRPRGAAARAGRRTGSGRRIRFWVEALQGEEAVRQRDERDVVVPAAKRAPLEVIEAERVLELAVVLRDAPAQLGEAHQLEQRRLRGQVGQPVLDGLGLPLRLSLIHISEPTRLGMISYAV